MKFSVPPFPAGRPTSLVEAPTSRFVLPNVQRSGFIVPDDPERLQASVRELGVVGMNGAMIRAYGNLPVECQTALRDSSHPLTDFALEFTSGEYAGCEWKIGKGNPENPDPVNAPWVSDVLSTFQNQEESTFMLKKRMLYAFRSIGIFALGLFDDTNSKTGLGLKMYPYEDVKSEESYSYNMTDVSHRLVVDLKNPFMDGRHHDYYPVIRDAAGGMSSSLFEVRRTDMRTGRAINTPVIRNAPLYELWWALIRGDLGAAESIATQNGILWFNTEEEDDLAYTHEQAGLPSASQDHMSVANAMNTTFGNGDTREGEGALAQTWMEYSKKTWDHPKRHLSRSPLPMWGPKAPQWITVGRAFDSETESKLGKTELRIAQGLDLPAEWILGAVDTARQNLQNDKTTTSRLQAAIRQAGHELDQIISRSLVWNVLRSMGRSDYRDYFVYTDWTRMTTQPDRSEDWKWAHENLGVKREHVAAGLGFPTGSLLDDSEHKEWLQERIILGGHGSDRMAGGPGAATDKQADKSLVSQNRTVVGTVASDKQSAAIAQPNLKTGVMIALKVDPRFAVQGGLAPDDLHITLMYLGKTVDVDFSKVDQALQALDVQSYFPLVGDLEPLGRFQGVEDGTKDAWFLTPDVPGLIEFQQVIDDAMSVIGVESASSHSEYVPHVTVGYTETGMALDELPVGGPVEFTGFEFVYGEKVVQYNQVNDQIDEPDDPRLAAGLESASEAQLLAIETAINAAAEIETEWLNAVLSSAYDVEVRQIASRVAAKADRSVHEFIRAAKDDDNYSAILFDERILAASSFDVDKELDKAFEAIHNKIEKRFSSLPARMAASIARATKGTDVDKEALTDLLLRHSRPTEAANRTVAAMKTKLRAAVTKVRDRMEKAQSAGKTLDNELLTASVSLGEAAESSVMPIVNKALADALGGATIRIGQSATANAIEGILSTRPFDDIAAALDLKVEYTWIYGDEERVTFDPHFNLNERSFASWGDELLETPFEAAWIGKTHLHPGDHPGCLCSYRFKLGRITTTIAGNPFALP